MKSQSPLITLRDLAQDAVEQAAQQLGQVRQAQQAAEQQLSMLLNYQDEYRQKLNHTLCDGMVKQWQDKQQRLNAFETLHTRAITAEQQQENKRDQKLMDEFAQRSAQRNINP